jgi:hypothetical protein
MWARTTCHFGARRRRPTASTAWRSTPATAGSGPKPVLQRLPPDLDAAQHRAPRGPAHRHGLALAPVEFQWTDRSSAEICAQMRDPDRNGGRDEAGLIEHILHDAELIGFITWSFDPGAGRARPRAACRRIWRIWRSGPPPGCLVRRSEYIRATSRSSSPQRSPCQRTSRGCQSRMTSSERNDP